MNVPPRYVPTIAEINRLNYYHALDKPLLRLPTLTPPNPTNPPPLLPERVQNESNANWVIYLKEVAQIMDNFMADENFEMSDLHRQEVYRDRMALHKLVNLLQMRVTVHDRRQHNFVLNRERNIFNQTLNKQKKEAEAAVKRGKKLDDGEQEQFDGNLSDVD